MVKTFLPSCTIAIKPRYSSWSRTVWDVSPNHPVSGVQITPIATWPTSTQLRNLSNKILTAFKSNKNGAWISILIIGGSSNWKGKASAYLTYPSVLLTALHKCYIILTFKILFDVKRYSVKWYEAIFETTVRSAQPGSSRVHRWGSKRQPSKSWVRSWR